jgi:hypothetical protein
VENTNFSPTGRYRNNPSHEDIFNDLVNKKKENYSIYNQLHRIISDTYNCKSINLLNRILDIGIIQVEKCCGID